jgi:hypothetical protein
MDASRLSEKLQRSGVVGYVWFANEKETNKGRGKTACYAEQKSRSARKCAG